MNWSVFYRVLNSSNNFVQSLEIKVKLWPCFFILEIIFCSLKKKTWAIYVIFLEFYERPKSVFVSTQLRACVRDIFTTQRISLAYFFVVDVKHQVKH